MHKVALEEVLFRVLRFSPFSIIPPLFHVHFPSHYIGWTLAALLNIPFLPQVKANVTRKRVGKYRHQCSTSFQSWNLLMKLHSTTKQRSDMCKIHGKCPLFLWWICGNRTLSACTASLNRRTSVDLILFLIFLSCVLHNLWIFTKPRPPPFLGRY